MIGGTSISVDIAVGLCSERRFTFLFTSVNCKYFDVNDIPFSVVAFNVVALQVPFIINLSIILDDLNIRIPTFPAVSCNAKF